MKLTPAQKKFDDKRRSNDTLADSCTRLGDARVSSFPTLLHIDVNNNCNLSCPFCVNKFRRENKLAPGLMSMEQFKFIIDMLGPYLKTINFGEKSEPTLNKDIYKMIGYASNKYGISANMTTNFNILSDESAKELIDSQLDGIYIGADGATQATYEKYRTGGNLGSVLSNIRLVNKLKKSMGSKRPNIWIQYIVFKHNEHEIPEAKKMAEELGIGINFMPGGVFDVGQLYKDWVAVNPEYSKYIIKEETVNGRKAVKISHKPSAFACKQPWYSLAIDANGLVYTCCGEHEVCYSAGNIFKDSFDDIWNGKMFMDARNYLARKESQGAVPCRSCCDIPKEPEIFYIDKVN